MHPIRPSSGEAPRLQLTGQQVRFADGSAVEADAVVCCTGYALRFPFLSEALFEIKRNSVELYKHMFHPDVPTLAFMGLCNVAGSTFPVVEIQGCWVARVLAGSEHLPSREEMHAAIERYSTHPSHRSPVPMQVQLLEYVEDIAGMLGCALIFGGIWAQCPGGSPGHFRQRTTGAMGLGGSHRIRLIEEDPWAYP